MLRRGYSLLHVKAIDEDQRTIAGTATTPEPDRMGDIVVSEGVQFKNPLPLLLYHDHKQPVGTVRFERPTKDGIRFQASLPQVSEPGRLKERIAEAWESVKNGLIRGVSIGFRPLGEDSIEFLKTGGLRFLETEVLELSLVAVPANAEATIDLVKSLDQPVRAALGTAPVPARPTAGVSARLHTGTRMKKPISDQIKEYEATRAAKVAERDAIIEASADKGETLDDAQSEQYDTLKTEIKAIDTHLVRLREVETEQKASATEVKGATVQDAAVSRGGQVIRVKAPDLPPGIGFARVAICKVAGYLDHRNPAEIAKERYPSHEGLHTYLKAAVPAGTTSEAVWASPLVDPTNLASEFIEFLRPMTIIGKFGTDGIPSLRRVPFNVRVIGQTSGGNGYWVGQGAPKPLTSFAFEATTLGIAKVAAISVITEELARLSVPSAETLVRDGLAGAVIERIDTDFVDPAVGAVTNVSPASITNGLTALSSAGTSADNARTDIQNLLQAFILANINPANLVLIMPNTLALALSLLRNSLGQPEFPGLTMNGGRLEGIPVITSQYVANQSGFGNMVIAVKADEIFLSDDGQVTVDASREASLQMLDNPTNNSATATPTTMVSMWQTNSIALRAERFINWARRRTGAVVYMDDVNWGSIGSPS